jgi:hypothetical protein
VRLTDLGRQGIIVSAFAVITMIAAGIDWLVEGRISKEFGYFILWMWGLLFVTTLFEKLDGIRDRAEKNEEQIEEIEKRISDLEKAARATRY